MYSQYIGVSVAVKEFGRPIGKYRPIAAGCVWMGNRWLLLHDEQFFSWPAFP